MTNYRPICDQWILARSKLKRDEAGNKQTYYGAYPNGFLHRAREVLGISTLDPLLHVCGGMVRAYPVRGLGPHDKTVDLDPSVRPDYVMDVREDLPHCPYDPDGWPAILADPPYTEADAEHYLGGTGHTVFPQPNALLRLMLDRVRPGGRVGMLHYFWPRPPSKPIPALHRGVPYLAKIRLVAAVGVLVGYGNRIRLLSVYEKEAPVCDIPNPGRVCEVRRGVFVIEEAS